MSSTVLFCTDTFWDEHGETFVALDPTIDWALPYYRDVGVALTWGFTPYDYFLTVFSRAADVTSGGRQMPGHWSDPARNVFSHSSAIATQYPHAAGRCLRRPNGTDDSTKPTSTPATESCSTDVRRG